MNCTAAKRAIEDYMDGRLARSEETDLRAHAAGCGECAAGLAAAEGFAAAVSGALREARPPRSLRARVADALAREGAGRQRRNVLRRHGWGLGVAAAAAAALLAIAFWPAFSPSPQDGARESEPAPAPRKDTVALVLSGDVEFRGGEREAFARTVAGQELPAGSVVRAVGAEPAELRWPSGVNIVLDGGSELTIAPDPLRPATAQLTKGQLFAEVEKGRPFAVLTALGNVESRGTKFGVTLDESAGEHGGLAVAVTEGAVQVERRGACQTVEAGHCWQLGPGGSSRCEGRECCRRRLQWLERRGGAGGCGGGGRGRGHGCGPKVRSSDLEQGEQGETR